MAILAVLLTLFVAIAAGPCPTNPHFTAIINNKGNNSVMKNSVALKFSGNIYIYS